VRIRYERGADRVVIEFARAAAAGAPQEIHPGLRLATDEAGRWVALIVDHASARLAAVDASPAGPAGRGSRASTAGAPVTVYSDGGCLGNPGPGGWAARIRYADGRIVELGGAEARTTNNRMELKAAIEALRRVRACPQIVVVTDSEYLRRGITEWIHGWKRRGWLTANRTPVLNRDLWQELDQLNHAGVEWRYTRGHAADPDNERCDELARAFALGGTPALSGQ